MKTLRQVLQILVLAAPAAWSADLQLTGVGTNGVLAGVYIGPYEALIDGVPTPVICDDFSAETLVGQEWTANVFTFADLANSAKLQQTRWGREGFSLVDYQQVAWLAMQLSNFPSNSLDCAGSDQCAGDIQFAIWSKFDPHAATHLTSVAPDHLPFVQTWLDRASAEYGKYDYSEFILYTPPAREGAPQEFIVVKTPEPSEVVLIALELSGALGLALFARRHRHVRAKQS